MVDEHVALGEKVITALGTLNVSVPNVMVPPVTEIVNVEVGMVPPKGSQVTVEPHDLAGIAAALVYRLLG